MSLLPAVTSEFSGTRGPLPDVLSEAQEIRRVLGEITTRLWAHGGDEHA